MHKRRPSLTVIVPRSHIGETFAAGGLHQRTPEGQPRGHRRRGTRPGDGAPPFLLKLHLSQVDALAAVQQVEHQADEVLRPFREAADRLQTMPGGQ